MTTARMISLFPESIPSTPGTEKEQIFPVMRPPSFGVNPDAPFSASPINKRYFILNISIQEHHVRTTQSKTANRIGRYP